MADFIPSVQRVDRQGGFAAIPGVNIQRSTFDRSHGVKTAFGAGTLYPIFADEALPGDTISLSATLFCRMATPIRPVLDAITLDLQFFAVPLRLLWSNFKKFMGEQVNPGDSTSYVTPKINTVAGGFARESIYDYMGVPPAIHPLTVNAFFFRAYNLIWNEWYRDQNLQNSVSVPVTDGPDVATTYTLLKRGKRHDYFTSALPWPQKGTAVSLPLGSTAPLVGNPGAAAVDVTVQFGASSVSNLERNVNTTPGNVQFPAGGGVAADNMRFVNPGLDLAVAAPGGTLPYANLATATAATINQWREALQIQSLLERDARGGTRYQELIRSQFGVISDDARMQRPEYLGSTSVRMGVNPVPNTSSSALGTPQGSLAAFIAGATNGRGFTKSFTEHCVVLGLASVRADMSYQQGLHKKFTRSTRYDYFWPALANLGEQPIYSREIFADGTAGDDTIFGYQERYSEYKYHPSVITGKMRSSDPQPLDSWHLAQNFSSRPLLNSTFIEESPPISRVIAVPSEPQFLLDAFFDYKHVRPMPVYAIPANLERF